MKKTGYLLSLLAVSLLFIACEKDDITKTITFDKNSIEVIVGQTDVVNVSGGVSPYTVKSNDETIATAAIEGNVITVTGVKAEQTMVEVKDADGNSAKFSVKVIEDPYKAEKEDATVRIAWDKLKKVEGTDEGTYTLTKGADKLVTYTWEADENNSIVLTFTDAADKVVEPAPAKATREESKEIGKLVVKVDGEETAHIVTAYDVIQVKAAKEGDPVSFWITFKANDIEGLCVAPLTTAAE